MSLYIHGGIIGDSSDAPEYRQKLTDLCRQVNIGLSCDSLDEGDREEIDNAVKDFGDVNLYYSIYDPFDGSEPTVWLEARTIVIWSVLGFDRAVIKQNS